MTVTAVPNKDDLVNLLEGVLDLSSASNTVILNKFNAKWNGPWNILVLKLKAIAERQAALELPRTKTERENEQQFTAAVETVLTETALAASEVSRKRTFGDDYFDQPCKS